MSTISADKRRSDKHRPIEGRDDLLALFRDSEKPPSRHLVGAEAEKFGVHRETGKPLPYEGSWSVLRVLEALAARHGWSPEAEVPGGPLIALTRANASITLEPGGQLELSGAPLETIHLICAEASGHVAELRDISNELEVSWLGVGFHPFARQADLTWVPKQRYGIMQRYLPTRGAHGLDMMRRTATVQANFDYSSEGDAMRKLRVSLRLSPLVTAMFANSPFYEGRVFGGRSYRAKVWLDVDPARQGLVRRVLEGNGGYDDYVEWALDAPMFLVKREGRALDNAGQTFRSFLADGFEGERATLSDWETHLNTLFPEVRLKRTLEVRGADSLPSQLLCSLPALWTGLLYDPRALDEAEALCEGWQHDELEELRARIPGEGLGATFRGAKLASWAEKVLELSRAGLARRSRLNRSGNDESVHLASLTALVSKGWSPADALLDGLPGDADADALRRAILERSRL